MGSDHLRWWDEELIHKKNGQREGNIWKTKANTNLMLVFHFAFYIFQSQIANF